MYLKRAITPVLLQACRQFPAVLVTGPRQSGKTTLVLVCNVREPTPLPDRVTALPWHTWPRWLQEHLSE